MTISDKPDSVLPVEAGDSSRIPADNAKEIWSKPEIVDYRAVTVARGLQWRIGDGFSNLS